MPAPLTAKELLKPGRDFRIPLLIEKLKKKEEMILKDGTKSKVVPLDPDWEKVLLSRNASRIGKLLFYLEKKDKKVTSGWIGKSKDFGGGGGSGAGAAATKLGESAQCLYCDQKWSMPQKTDYAPALLEKTYKKRNTIVDQKPPAKMWTEQDDTWVVSSILSAEILFKHIGQGQYEFHRGERLVQEIEQTFAKLNKEAGKFFSDINKWTPADIWISKRNYKLNFKGSTLLEFNQYLLEEALKKNLMGVSLKKTKSAILKEVNYKKQRRSFSYGGHTTGKTGFFNAKDVYVNYGQKAAEGGAIQFREFSPTWQGEIKGKTANHGKVSGGPIRNIFKQFANINLMEQKILTKMVQTKTDTKWLDLFYKYYMGTEHKNKNKKLSKGDFIAEVTQKPILWQISKFLGAEICWYLANHKKADMLVSSIIQYAASESELSAPYIKVM